MIVCEFLFGFDEIMWLHVGQVSRVSDSDMWYICLAYNCHIFRVMIFSSPSEISHSVTVIHNLPDRTTLPAQHFRSSGLLCRWSDGLE